jgi:hypothetical protein
MYALFHAALKQKRFDDRISAGAGLAKVAVLVAKQH